jgi:hypothetical protein
VREWIDEEVDRSEGEVLNGWVPGWADERLEVIVSNFVAPGVIGEHELSVRVRSGTIHRALGHSIRSDPVIAT